MRHYLLLPPWQIAAIVLVALAAYAGSMLNGYTYDDPMVITDAAPFLGHGPYSALFSTDYFRFSREGTYRPVVTASYIVDFQLGGLRIGGYHAQNIFWHVLNALGVAALAARLLTGERRRVAFVSGLLFACHPLTSEVVENVSFREDLLATCFVLLAMLLAQRGTSRSLAAAAVAYTLALFSKESAVVMPVLLLGCRLAFPAAENELKRRATVVREVAVLGLVTLAYLAIRFGPMVGPEHYATFAGGSRAATLWAMPQVLAHYIRLVFFPWPLIADYSGYYAFGGASAWVLALPACAVALWLAWRHVPVVAYGLGWFLCALAPVSNLIAIPIFAAERFLYLPLVGPMLAASAVAAAIDARAHGPWRKVAVAGGIAVLGIFIVLTNVRHLAWRNNLALWRDIATNNPRSYRAHANLGIELRGSNPRLAAAEFEESLRLCPYVPGADDVDNVLGSSNAVQLAKLRLGLGDLDAARAAFQLAIKIRPSNQEPVAGLRDVARARKEREVNAPR